MTARLCAGLEALGHTNFVDFELQDDGDGPYIRAWHAATAQPSQAEIDDAIAGLRPVDVPARVSMRQARLALARAGRLADADAAVAGMAGTAGDEARVEWEYATTMERAHPLVASLGAQLGMTETDIDDLFRTAATL